MYDLKVDGLPTQDPSGNIRDRIPLLIKENLDNFLKTCKCIFPEGGGLAAIFGGKARSNETAIESSLESHGFEHRRIFMAYDVLTLADPIPCTQFPGQRYM